MKESVQIQGGIIVAYIDYRWKEINPLIWNFVGNQLIHADLKNAIDHISSDENDLIIPIEFLPLHEVQHGKKLCGRNIILLSEHIFLLGGFERSNSEKTISARIYKFTFQATTSTWQEEELITELQEKAIHWNIQVKKEEIIYCIAQYNPKYLHLLDATGNLQKAIPLKQHLQNQTGFCQLKDDILWLYYHLPIKENDERVEKSTIICLKLDKNKKSILQEVKNEELTANFHQHILHPFRDNFDVC